jgi:hypothetical protein
VQAPIELGQALIELGQALIELGQAKEKQFLFHWLIRFEKK